MVDDYRDGYETGIKEGEAKYEAALRNLVAAAERIGAFAKVSNDLNITIPNKETNFLAAAVTAAKEVL